MPDLQTILSESEAGFQALFQYAPMGIIVIDRQGIIVLANPCIEKYFGYRKTELIGQPVEILIPYTRRKKHEQHLEAYFAHPKARPMGYGLNLFARKKDGLEFPVEISLAHYELFEEQMAVAFITDITEKLKAEEQAKKSEEDYRFIFDGIQESFMLQQIIRDDNGNIVDLLFLEINPATEKFLGRSRSEIIGHFRSEFFGKPNETLINIIKRVEKGENVRHQQYLDVIGRWFDRSFYSLKPGELIILSTDITQQKIDEEALEKANASLEEKVVERTLELTQALEREKALSELKSRFMSIASHEFRTPLSTILSSTSLIEKYNKEEQEENRKKHTGRIKSAVKNLTDILTDFLSLDKLEQGQVKLVKEPLSLYELSTELIDELNGILKTGQAIHLTYNGGTDIIQDKKILRNVLLNLLSNAIKYSNEYNGIYLIIDINDGIVAITVKDEGIGIPEEEQKNLFEKFYRAKNAAGIQGTGLGLNIVKRYIELLDGNITFVSKHNEGTTFTITFPA